MGETLHAPASGLLPLAGADSRHHTLRDARPPTCDNVGRRYRPPVPSAEPWRVRAKRFGAYATRNACMSVALGAGGAPVTRTAAATIARP